MVGIWKKSRVGTIAVAKQWRVFVMGCIGIRFLMKTKLAISLFSILLLIIVVQSKNIATFLPHLFRKEKEIEYIRPSDFYVRINNEIIPKNCTYWDFHSKVKSLKELTVLKNLRLLNLEGQPIANISGINEFKKLRLVNISYTKVSDLTPLKDTQIEALHITGTQVKDITMLPPTLKRIFLSKSFSKKNIEEYLKKNPTCDIVFK